nr:sigma 54-interacting transcriptional regulator [Planococcus glaciei]
MKKVIATAEKAATTKLPVLLIGESGTGKELIAEAIHWASSSSGQLNTLYCHGANEKLINQLNQELSGGTIYCERIDLLPPPLQVQLLKMAQKQINGDTYFIASVGEDPVELIASKKLLKELYYFFLSDDNPIGTAPEPQRRHFAVHRGLFVAAPHVLRLAGQPLG